MTFLEEKRNPKLNEYTCEECDKPTYTIEKNPKEHLFCVHCGAGTWLNEDRIPIEVKKNGNKKNS